MNAVPHTAIPSSSGHPLSAGTQQPRRRRGRSRTWLQQVGLLVCLTGLAALLVGYVAFCARATRHCYHHSRLRARLHRVQVERKLLEAQVADLERVDRILFEAKKLNMRPRQALQYVALVPKPPATREFRQASARP